MYVKKSPLIGRGFILFLAFICVALPIMGIVLNFMDGNAFHFGFIIGLGLFSLVGFYFIRLFLWNTYGKEVIEIGESSVSYYVDYHYFKGNQKQMKYEELTYEFTSIGFEEEQKGNLIIVANVKEFIHSAVNMPNAELIELIGVLEKR
ncbi:hypothetical protein FLGE108171_02195 [Flavobacterium gelidilacus]